MAEAPPLNGLDAIRAYQARKNKAKSDRNQKKKDERTRFVQTFLAPSSADAIDRRRGGIPLERSKIGDPKREDSAQSGGGAWGQISGALDKVGGSIFGAIADAQAQQQRQTNLDKALEYISSQRFGQSRDLSPIEAVMLAMPDKNQYLQPYMQAEGAAQDAYKQGVGVINESTGELKGDLSKNQQDYLRMQQQYKQQLGADASASQQFLDRTLAPTGLAKDLGLAPGLEAEAALLRGQAAQEAAGQRDLFNRMAEVQGQDYDARVQGADGAQAAAQMAASQNLSAILAQIGMGKADAERQYTEDSNRVAQANAEAERQAREAYQQQVKQQQDWERQQVNLYSQTQIPLWETKVGDYASRFPRATAAFEALVKSAGDGDSGRARAKAMMPRMIQDVEREYNITLNPTTLNRWLDEYYSGETVFNQKDFVMGGGDIDFLRQAGLI